MKEIGQSLEKIENPEMKDFSSKLENANKSFWSLFDDDFKDFNNNKDILEEKGMAVEERPVPTDEILYIKGLPSYSNKERVVLHETTQESESNESSGDGEDNTYPPNSEVRIDGERYRTDDNGKPHAKYNAETKQWELIPNNEYTVSGYTYRTNEKGEIIHAEGFLRLKSHEGRKAINDDVANMKEGDDKGHLIADMFDGSNHMDNLVPMDMHLNRSEYKKMEERLAKALAEGKEVSVDIEVEYDENGRPKTFIVTTIIDGEVEVHVFSNDSESEGEMNE